MADSFIILDPYRIVGITGHIAKTSSLCHF
jgi:hypothetical protein